MWSSAIDTPTNRLLLRWIWSSAGGGGRTCEDAWGIDEGRAITNDEGCGPIVLAALEALASPADLTYQTNNQRWTRRDREITSVGRGKIDDNEGCVGSAMLLARYSFHLESTVGYKMPQIPPRVQTAN